MDGADNAEEPAFGSKSTAWGKIGGVAARLQRSKVDVPAEVPSQGLDPQSLETHISTMSGSKEKTALSDDDLIGMLDKRYFEEAEFDATKEILEKLEDEEEVLPSIDETIKRYDRTLDVVNTRLCQRVMDNSSAFVEGMAQIQTLETDLTMTTVICSNGRRSLRRAQIDLTSGGLEVISKYRKKQMYLTTIELVSNIRALKDSDEGLNEALQRDDLLSAVKCAMALRKLQSAEGSNKLMAMPCTEAIWERVSAKSRDLQQLLVMKLEMVIDDLLISEYENLVRAFVLMRLEDLLLQTLRKGFHKRCIASAARALSEQLVQRGVDVPAHLRAGTKANSRIDPQQMLEELSRGVTHEYLLPSLQACFRTLAEVMKTFATIVTTHTYIIANASGGTNLSVASEADDHTPVVGAGRDTSQGRMLWGSSEEQARLLSLEGASQRALVMMRLGLWEWSQAVACAVLENAQLPAFKVEGYLAFLNAVNQFVVFGEHFACTGAAAPPCQLQSLVANKSKAVFDKYHRDNIDLLRGVIESEQWKQYPLNERFSFRDLKEMRAEASAQSSKQDGAAFGWPFDDSQRPGGSGDDGEVRLQRFVDDFAKHGNPWAAKARQEDQAFARPPVKDGPSALADDVDAAGGSAIVTITTGVSLNVVKFIGRYTQIMDCLPMLAEHCFTCMRDIFHVYVDAVYTIFAYEAIEQAETSGGQQSLGQGGGGGRVSTSLGRATSRHMSSMVSGMASGYQKSKGALVGTTATRTTQKIVKEAKADATLSAQLKAITPKGVEVDSTLRPSFSVSSPNTLYGLVETSVAAESLDFVRLSLEHVSGRIEEVLPKKLEGSGSAYVQSFHERVVGVQGILHRALAQRLINMDAYCAAVLAVKWDEIKEMSLDRNSSYVEEMLLEFKALRQRMDASDLPRTCHDKVWHHVTIHVMENLVDAFSNIKKCSTGGRALMSLDLQMLRSGMMITVPLEGGIPQWKYVDNYIKAHYLLEDELIGWIRNHPEYHLKHIHALINNLPINIKRKTRNDLIQQATEIHAQAANRDAVDLN